MYARSGWSENGRKFVKLTPFRTKSKVTAGERIAEVNEVQSHIKVGIKLKFHWPLLTPFFRGFRG